MKYIILCCGLIISTFCFSQAEKADIITFQKDLNLEYTDSIRSPLTRAERLKFTKHEFYPIDLKYRVKATLVRTPAEKPFKMATTKGTTKDFVKYGELNFVLNGKKYKLNVYQYLILLEKEETKNYLFLPFRDLTNSVETYGGGRFIDLTLPEGNTIILDFNKAHNPYCAYTDRFACPITPMENTLNIKIKAGIKGPKDH